MKVVKVVLVAVVFFLATSVVFSQERINSRDSQIVFSVNIDCHSCEQKIKKNIPYERGVRNLTTDLDKQLVTIRYRTSRTNKENLKKSIEKLGFTCTEVKPAEK